MFWNRKKKTKEKPKPKPKQSAPIPKKPHITPSPTPPPKFDKPKASVPPVAQKVSREPPRAPPTAHLEPEREFMRIFKRLTYRHRAWDIWKDFVVMFACALSNPVDKAHYNEREELYMKTIKKYIKQEQNMFPDLVAQTVMALELNPEQDFLGKIYMDLNLGNERGGQFFTPYCVCDMMVKISLGDVVSHVEEEGYITVNDPCCGAGATLIAGIHEAKRQLEKVKLNFQNHILVVGQEIDFTTALMCYIQLSLLGVAGYIKIGNTLTDPMTSSDTLENYWFTPMYFFDVWSTRRLLRGRNLL